MDVMTFTNSGVEEGNLRVGFDSGLISMLGAACHSGQVQYKAEAPAINATRGLG
jgi:hypothetical protein